MTATASHRVDAEEKPIQAFMVANAAPPPPPPPPPPPASSASHPTPQIVKPVQIPQTSFVQPREIPLELPKVATPMTTAVEPASTPSSEPAGEPGGVPGGVAGGVTGGVEGGVVGGTVGGEVGGVLGGTPGGVVGGTPGGTGTEPAPAPPPPPEIPDRPVRVGGDVKAPTVVKRVQPDYTEVARKGRIQGVVIVEAIIDRNGNVDQVRIIKGLPGGLSERAMDAVKQWRFRPGTLGGQAVDVIFNLTVNFTLE